MEELRKLNAQEPAEIPDAISVVTTPLQLRAWEAELHNLVNTPSSSWTASAEASGLGLITGLILVLAHLTSVSIHPKLTP